MAKTVQARMRGDVEETLCVTLIINAVYHWAVTVATTWTSAY
jgi:hypothetical protein